MDPAATRPQRLHLRDLGRACEIAAAFSRVGRHDLALVFGRGVGLEEPRERHAGVADGAAPVRFRHMLEELGPTFVKLGQVLATRSDLLDPAWIHALEALHNRVPAVPWAAIEGQLAEDFAAAPSDVFASIEHEPLAAASIAQVHAAVLHDGTPVIVKVRRPGIRPAIDADLRLLTRFAQALVAHVPAARLFRPVEMIREFRDSLARELDFAAEARNAEQIAARFAGSGLVVPKVFWDYTGERVNVQERITGIPIAELEALRGAGLDPVRLARLGAQVVLRMMLKDGFFHADPHPGNVFALPGNRLALIDFGMVGRLTPTRRREIVDLLGGLVRHDAPAVVDVLSNWVELDGDAADLGALEHDVEAFVERYHGVPLGRLPFGRLLLDVTGLVRAHRLALPGDLALVIKVFVTLEGLGRQLDPDFDMAKEAAPFLRAAVRERHSLQALRRGAQGSIGKALELGASLPRDLGQLLNSLKRGKAVVRFESQSVKTLAEQFAHSANRLTMGVVLAALVVGSAITMTVHGGPELLGLNVFGLMGFVGAVLAGAWLVASIWRSGGGR
jgi:ubiquinone biosynthesis protein